MDHNIHPRLPKARVHWDTLSKAWRCTQEVSCGHTLVAYGPLPYQAINRMCKFRTDAAQILLTMGEPNRS